MLHTSGVGVGPGVTLGAGDGIVDGTWQLASGVGSGDEHSVEMTGVGAIAGETARFADGEVTKSNISLRSLAALSRGQMFAHQEPLLD